ncbi:MAG: hypothetical protein ABSH48_13395 [Verrucomicrobiota bacterium]
MKTSKSVLAAALVASLASCVARAGINAGDQLSISGTVLPGSDTGYVSYGGGPAINCYAGAFSLNVVNNTQGGSSFTIESFCTDVGVEWKNSDTYTARNFAGQSGVDPKWSGIAGIEDAAYLYNTYFVPNQKSITLDQDAGLQLAIWKVLYDSAANGTISSTAFNSGKLQAWNFDGTAMTDAENYVTDINTAIAQGKFVTYTGLWLDPNDNGSQGLIWTPQTPGGNGGTVPEPSTIFTGVLLLLPLGVAVSRVLRNRRVGSPK